MMGEYDAGYENCIDSMVRQMEDMQFRIDNLHRENTKLHELVADLWHELHAEEGSAQRRMALADRIDAEHEAKVSYWQGASYKDGYDEGFASADDWLGQHEDAMAEHGWVKLPVSEDGDVLHIGELVDEKLPFGGYAAPAPIDTMELSRGASGYRWMVKLDAESRALISPKLLRHHHEPTVEDVLREFAEKMAENTAMYVAESWDADERDEADAAAIAEYAAKLRLADDGKEQ